MLFYRTHAILHINCISSFHAGSYSLCIKLKNLSFIRMIQLGWNMLRLLHYSTIPARHVTNIGVNDNNTTILMSIPVSGIEK